MYLCRVRWCWQCHPWHEFLLIQQESAQIQFRKISQRLKLKKMLVLFYYCRRSEAFCGTYFIKRFYFFNFFRYFIINIFTIVIEVP